MARRESQRTELTRAQRGEVFDRTVKIVGKQFFDPKFNGTDWPNLALAAREHIVAQANPEAFELGMLDLVRRLGTSHTGFFHDSVRRISARLAIGANFRKAESESGPVWVVLEVHAGGPGQKAGLRASDVLVKLDGKPIIPPEAPTFPMNTELPILVQRGSEQLKLTLSIPPPSSRKQPYAEMDPVTFEKLPHDVGYMKVPILPGLLGLDVARKIDRAMAELSDCERLVLDLRGHVGGGLGVLRLMSHLTPDELPIGYTVTRKLAERGYDKTELKRLDSLPTHLPNPLAIASMAARFGGRDLSVLLVSEGLGPKRWHGRAAILINENTISAGEMVAAFAAENGLATLVGTETAGRLIPGSGSKVGYGYVLVMPKARYFTWNGRSFEGAGIQPAVNVAWGIAPGRDNQLDSALAM